MGQTMTNAQINQKNKDRYMAMQQSKQHQTNQQQFFMGSQASHM